MDLEERGRGKNTSGQNLNCTTRDFHFHIGDSFVFRWLRKQTDPVTGDLPVQRDRASSAKRVLRYPPISFICEYLRLETLPFSEHWKRRERRRRGTETWSLNYRPRGIRRTFAVNSISTLVRTRETFPRHFLSFPPLPRPLLTSEGPRQVEQACKYIFTRGPAKLS